MTTTDLVAMLVAAIALGWGGLGLGLYLGERGRRQAAERWLAHGSPEESTAEATSAVPGGEPETRLLEAADAYFSEETLERAAQDLMEEAEAKGFPMTSEQARSDALDLLRGKDVMP